jgi:hypothetical protein
MTPGHVVARHILTNSQLPEVDRNVRALIIALLCVLAVSLAAATLANPQDTAGTGGGPGGGTGGDAGTADEQGNEGEDGADIDDNPLAGKEPIQLGGACIPFLLSPAFAGFLLVAYGLIGFLAYRTRGLVPAVLVLFVITVLVVTPSWLLFTDCGSQTENDQDGTLLPELPSGPSQGGEATGGSGDETLFSPPRVLAVLFVLAIVLGLVAFRATGDSDPVDTSPIEEPVSETDDEALGAVGAVAGDAADRILEDADVENEVYRAWREMTDHLDVRNPETSTPSEFADVARDAGMDDAHVDELTDLFRDVRYGGADVTPEREQQAVDALRAIEASYGGGD